MNDNNCIPPDMPPISNQDRYQIEIEEGLSECRIIAEEAKRDLIEPIESELRDINLTLIELSSIISGGIESLIESIRETVQTSYDKLSDKLREGFRELSAINLRFGLAPISPEEIAVIKSGGPIIPENCFEKIVGYFCEVCEPPSIIDWMRGRSGLDIPEPNIPSTPAELDQPQSGGIAEGGEPPFDPTLLININLPGEDDGPSGGSLGGDAPPVGILPPEGQPKVTLPEQLPPPREGSTPEQIRPYPRPSFSPEEEIIRIREEQRIRAMGGGDNQPETTRDDVRRGKEQSELPKAEAFKFPWFGSNNACEALEKILPFRFEKGKSLSQMLGFSWDKEGKFKYLAPRWWFELTNWMPKAFQNMFGEGITSLLSVVDGFLYWTWQNHEKPIVPIAYLTLWKGMIGAFDKYAGTDFLSVFKDLDYTRNALAPAEIPNENEAIEAYLAGGISKELLICWLSANNKHPQHWDGILTARQSKPTPLETIVNRRRNNITDEQYREMMRMNGFIRPDWQNQVMAAHAAWPGVDDAIRFMMRDVDDPLIVKRFRLDDEFEDKYRGNARLYIEGNGIDKDLALRFWRAHWQYPSFTAMVEMMRRLRPGRTRPGLEVYPEDVKQVLAANDYSPMWRDRMIEISYHTLTRTDAQRAFFINSLSEGELKQVYLDLGYNERDAEILVRFSVDLKEQKEKSRGSRGEARKILQQYEKSIVTESEAIELLVKARIQEKVAKELVQEAKRNRKARLKEQLIKEYGKAYLKGIHSKSETFAYMSSLGMDYDQIRDLIELWDAKRNANNRSIPAAQLCEWRSRGLITLEEQTERLVLLGYTAQDAKRIAETCGEKIEDKLFKKLKDLERKMDRDNRKTNKRMRCPPLEEGDEPGEASPGPKIP